MQSTTPYLATTTVQLVVLPTFIALSVECTAAAVTPVHPPPHLAGKVGKKLEVKEQVWHDEIQTYCVAYKQAIDLTRILFIPTGSTCCTIVLIVLPFLSVIGIPLAIIMLYFEKVVKGTKHM